MPDGTWDSLLVWVCDGVSVADCDGVESWLPDWLAEPDADDVIEQLGEAECDEDSDADAE